MSRVVYTPQSPMGAIMAPMAAYEASPLAWPTAANASPPATAPQDS